MSAPIPILFTIPNFMTAGSGRAMLNIVERLDRARWAPAVAVLKQGGKLAAEVEQLGIPLIEAPFAIPAKPYAGLPARAWKAARVFRPYRFVLWHSFHYGEDYTEPLIATLAGARAWVYTKKNMSWGSRAWRLRSLLARRIAAQNTDMLADFFRSSGLKRKTHLIPRGVDTKKFCPGLPPRLQLRARLGIPAESALLACVADLVPVKGHLTLLQALSLVPGVHLLIAGRPLDTEYTGSLQRETDALDMAGRVHFLGGVEDVPALLAECDLFILPTIGRGRMEGCPVALLEAMSCGKPCIATDIPGCRDLIVHQECGLLVQPDEPFTLADGMQRLLHDPQLASSLGTSARARVEKLYTIEREVEDHTRLYEEILGGHSA